MRVYLDNCCYNRPFDDQSQVRVRIETEAKLLIQAMMWLGSLEYAWSFMLDREIDRNPSQYKQGEIGAWRRRAVVFVGPDGNIRERAKEHEGNGIKPADAIHLACAEAAACDWFFTVDRGILKKMRVLGKMRVANPVDFIMEGVK